jgi:hypothetical protein
MVTKVWFRHFEKVAVWKHPSPLAVPKRGRKTTPPLIGCKARSRDALQRRYSSTFQRLVKKKWKKAAPAGLHPTGLSRTCNELRGRDLMCCCAPELSHGDLLLRLADDAGAQLLLTLGMELHTIRVAASES